MIYRDIFNPENQRRTTTYCVRLFLKGNLWRKGLDKKCIKFCYSKKDCIIAAIHKFLYLCEALANLEPFLKINFIVFNERTRIFESHQSFISLLQNLLFIRLNSVCLHCVSDVYRSRAINQIKIFNH